MVSKSRRTWLINYGMYQVGWLACVLGAASLNPWTGTVIAMVLVGVHLALTEQRSLEIRLVALATAVGVVVEMIQIALAVFSGVVRRVSPEPDAHDAALP